MDTFDRFERQMQDRAREARQAHVARLVHFFQEHPQLLVEFVDDPDELTALVEGGLSIELIKLVMGQVGCGPISARALACQLIQGR